MSVSFLQTVAKSAQQSLCAAQCTLHCERTQISEGTVRWRVQSDTNDTSPAGTRALPHLARVLDCLVERAAAFGAAFGRGTRRHREHDEGEPHDDRGPSEHTPPLSLSVAVTCLCRGHVWVGERPVTRDLAFSPVPSTRPSSLASHDPGPADMGDDNPATRAHLPPTLMTSLAQHASLTDDSDGPAYPDDVGNHSCRRCHTTVAATTDCVSYAPDSSADCPTRHDDKRVLFARLRREY